MSDELIGLVKGLVANIGHPVGMGIEPSRQQAEWIIKLVREHDRKSPARPAGSISIPRNCETCVRNRSDSHWCRACVYNNAARTHDHWKCRPSLKGN